MIDDDGIDCRPPNIDEVRHALAPMQNLVRRMHARRFESQRTVSCKGDPSICGNYCGISLLSTAYKVLQGICEKLQSNGLIFYKD